MDTQVIIIGGGPAGSTLGCYLSRAGVDNIILEKALHPRPHVGESLVTSTVRIFNEIGFTPVMEAEGFVRKYGASWTSWTGKSQFDIRFAEFPQPGVTQPYVWHVDRAKFDCLLLQYAAQQGSTVIEGSGVEEVHFDARGYAAGVTCKLGSRRVRLDAPIVVDASGRNTVLGQQLKLKRKDPHFNQFAVHAWFEDMDRGKAETAEFIHIHFLPIPRGWVWQIPITHTITSVGVVTEQKDFVKAGSDLEAFFARHVESSGVLAGRLRPARRIREFRCEGNYSYSMDRFVGDGWLLVGDAARFVDPIFSSGVSVAMSSAKFASEAIVPALAAGDYGSERFVPYEQRLRSGVNVWREFIFLYYKLMHLFTYFIGRREDRLEVLQLLQGEVYDRGSVKILDKMRRTVEEIERSESHLWKSQLGDLPIEELDRITQAESRARVA